MPQSTPESYRKRYRVDAFIFTHFLDAWFLRIVIIIFWELARRHIVSFHSWWHIPKLIISLKQTLQARMIIQISSHQRMLLHLLEIPWTVVPDKMENFEVSAVLPADDITVWIICIDIMVLYVLWCYSNYIEIDMLYSWLIVRSFPFKLCKQKKGFYS